ncbi:MAG: GH92 family glycosyl hydrolase [Lentimicrobium sp.]|jgi:predicted alpha-1,2-mannosidase|nr:GH92 family glycosyl hydrolase [Lentimicrobium sp.]
MKGITNLFSILFFLAISFLVFSGQAQQQPADYVNPFIGTGGHGHTFPGVTVPFGMVQLSPDTRLEGWDGCSGYHYSDEYIYGFSHTHLSGTGVPDYCDILLMPFTGEINLNNGYDEKPGYRSAFKHGDEQAEAGYYKVKLLKDNIDVELTATTRVGFHQYTYSQKENRAILIDLKHRDMVTDSWINLVNDYEIEGYRESTGWARKQSVYFVARFSKAVKKALFYSNDVLVKGSSINKSKNIKAGLYFEDGDDAVLVKVGISAVSAANARKNLETEIRDWDFQETRSLARGSWNKELSKIQVSGKDEAAKTIFYTALYHTMVAPNTYYDVNGEYLGRDFKTHTLSPAESGYYTVFSLWDTYRALHPLFTIIDQERTGEFIQTFINQYEQGGMLPVWELAANETWCMIGYHAVPVIADAWIKGIRDYNEEKALSAMVHSASANHFGLDSYRRLGYIPAGDEAESVSKTLEYAYDDWCIAQMAGGMGKIKLQDEYLKRAQSYKHVFDPQTQFMRARHNGGWFTPFDAAEVNFNYTEANAWQYSFYVPHDMDGFARLMHGKDALAKKLDDLFNAPSVTTGRDQSDITGLIGQYAHGNEPSHHIAYLYNYCGQPWRTQYIVNNIMKSLYKNQPDGLIGNEDCGQMSAWAVFSALGFYAVCPGSTQYAIGSPQFEEAAIRLENGKTFTIKARELSDKNRYIGKARLNGETYNKGFIEHADIMNGGLLEVEMSSTPNKLFGTGPGNEPNTGINQGLIQPAPYVSISTPTFQKEVFVNMAGMDGADIYYTLNGAEPDRKSLKFEHPLSFTETTHLKFRSYAEGFPPSEIQTAVYTKMPDFLELQLLSDYASQYSGSGPNNLIDGLKGSTDFRLGGWQGYEGTDLDAIIYIKNNETADSVSLRFLQDERSWIFMPAEVELWKSSDGENFTFVGRSKNPIPQTQQGIVIHEFNLAAGGLNERYLKIKARNAGPCPDWHPGSGNKTWIFADEISLKFAQ